LDENANIVFDKNGNLYIAKVDNHINRKIDPPGIIKAIARTGDAGYSNDRGFTTSAELKSPYRIASDTN